MLKGLLLTLLVLGGPVQAQLAHFCDVSEQVVETCCCGHDEQPLQAPADCPADDVADPCCRTVVSLSVDEAAAAAITPAGQHGVSAHDPPALTLPPDLGITPGDPRAALPAAQPCAVVSGHGTRTYLHTLRLRL